MKKMLYEETKFDSTTGEIHTTSKSFCVKTNSESFYMTYIENMSKFFDIKSIVDMKVLAKLSILAGFNTGIVSLSPADRDDILNSLGINNQQMSKALKSLCTLGLISGSKGRYVVNPAIFWKGDAKSREALMKNNSINITISID